MSRIPVSSLNDDIPSSTREVRIQEPSDDEDEWLQVRRTRPSGRSNARETIGRGGRGRGATSQSSKSNSNDDFQLPEIPTPVYSAEAEQTLIELLGQKSDIPVTRTSFHPFRGYLRSSLILNLAVTRGRIYLKQGGSLDQRMELARYFQFYGDDRLLRMINDHQELALEIKTLFREPRKHPTQWTPPLQFKGVIPHENILAYSNASREQKFDAGMLCLAHYFRHCYGDGDMSKAFYQRLWDEIPNEKVLDNMLQKNGVFRAKVIKEKGANAIIWAPVWIPNIDYLPRVKFGNKQKSALKTSSSYTQPSQESTNPTSIGTTPDETEMTTDSSMNDPFQSSGGIDTTQEGTIISELTNEQSNANETRDGEPTKSVSNQAPPLPSYYDTEEFNKALDLPISVMNIDETKLLQIDNDEAMNTIRTECLHYLLQYYPQHHDYILSKLLAQSPFFVLDAIRSKGSMTRFIDSLKLEIRRNVNQSTPCLYGQSSHASNVITDFNIEFEHDAFGNPAINKTSIDFVSEFVMILFPLALDTQHTISLVPVEKVFDSPPITTHDDLERERSSLAGIYVTSTQKINNSKIHKFEICVRSSLDLRFIKQTRGNSWCKEGAESIAKFLTDNRLRFAISRQNMSSHVPVAIIANTTQHEDIDQAISDISTLTFEDSGFMLDRNEITLHWGTVRSPDNQVVSCPVMSICATPASARSLRKALLRLNRLSKCSKRFGAAHNYLFYLARAETYEPIDNFVLGIRIQQSFLAAIWVAVIHGIDKSIDFHNDFAVQPDGSTSNLTISETLLSRDDPLLTFEGRPTFTPFTKIQRGPGGIWYFVGDILNVPIMKAYLLEFRQFLEVCYPDKAFDGLEIELSDPTDDNISASKNSYCANPTPPHTSNILVASTRKKDKMQAFQNTLASRYPDSAKKATSPSKPFTGYTTAAEIYNGYTASINLSQLTTKIDESTNTVLAAISDFRSLYVDTQTAAVDSALGDDNQRPNSPPPDTAAITAAHNQPASLSQDHQIHNFEYSTAGDEMDKSYDGPLRDQCDAVLASLDTAAANITPVGKSATGELNTLPRTTETLKKDVNSLRDASLSWDEQIEDSTQHNTEKTVATQPQSVKISLSRPKPNTGRNSLQTESKQSASSSRQAEVKQPDISPPEESMDPVTRQTATLGTSPSQFYPSGRPRRKPNKTLTQSDDETDN